MKSSLIVSHSHLFAFSVFDVWSTLSTSCLLRGTSRFHEYIVGRVTPTHTHTHTDIGTGVRTRRGSLERSRVVISARSVRTLSPYRINEWLDWSGTMNEHRRVLYKRARCGRLRRLLLSANKIPLRWLARVLIRLSLDAGFFLEIVVPIATFQTVDSTYRSR